MIFIAGLGCSEIRSWGRGTTSSEAVGITGGGASSRGRRPRTASSFQRSNGLVDNIVTDEKLHAAFPFSSYPLKPRPITPSLGHKRKVMFSDH
jgi:hypothetical protein